MVVPIFFHSNFTTSRLLSFLILDRAQWEQSLPNKLCLLLTFASQSKIYAKINNVTYHNYKYIFYKKAVLTLAESHVLRLHFFKQLDWDVSWFDFACSFTSGCHTLSCWGWNVVLLDFAFKFTIIFLCRVDFF